MIQCAVYRFICPFKCISCTCCMMSCDRTCRSILCIIICDHKSIYWIWIQMIRYFLCPRINYPGNIFIGRSLNHFMINNRKSKITQILHLLTPGYNCFFCINKRKRNPVNISTLHFFTVFQR